MVVAYIIVFLFSTVLAIGDYRFAGAYRDFVRYLKKNYTQKTVLFGHLAYIDYYTWGYAYYAYRYLPYEKIKPGRKGLEEIFLVSPAEKVLPIVLQHLSFANDPRFDKFLVDEHVYTSHIFLHNRRERTGFYSYDWGLLPFKITLKNALLEKFNIYRIPLNIDIGLSDTDYLSYYTCDSLSKWRRKGRNLTK